MNPRDAIMTLVESVERTYEDDVPEREATAIAAVVKLLRWSGFPDMSRNTAARGRKVEVLLVRAPHTQVGVRKAGVERSPAQVAVDT